MKRSNFPVLLALLCGAGLLTNGCLWKHARVQTRHFILTPIAASESAPEVPRSIEVEVGAVKLPSYLLREALVVRRSTNEVHYLANARWAERLDQGFRRVLTKNFSSLLASNEIHPSASGGAQPRLIVSVDVEEFDVDTEGRGTLLAQWRITIPGSNKPAVTGRSHLNQNGRPRGGPQAVVTTLSNLMARFSRELVDVAIRVSNAGGNS